MNKKHFHMPHRDHQGMALIIVMWVTLGLVTVALYFGSAMVFEYRAADVVSADLEAAHAIEGARNYILYVIENSEEPGRLPDTETYVYEDVPVGNAQFWLLGRTTEYTIDYSTPMFGLSDEASKLNLNTATLEMLEALPLMTPEFAASIIDWRDSDSEVTNDGAESQSYLLLETPYNCKDSKFETVEELRLVMNADCEVIYGEDLNRNGSLDTGEDTNDNGVLEPGIIEYLTVFSKEANTQADGSARISITNQQQLRQKLSDTFGQERANQLMSALGGGTQNLRSVLELYVRTGMTIDEFPQIEDSLTASTGETREGLIDINTAPAAVLACIPGIGVEYAEEVVKYRTGKTADDLASSAWITEVLEDQGVISAGPYITTRSYQFTADIVAVGHNGRGYRRDYLVIDTSGDAPVVTFRRDMTRLGWALGPQLRETLYQTAQGSTA